MREKRDGEGHALPHFVVLSKIAAFPQKLNPSPPFLSNCGKCHWHWQMTQYYDHMTPSRRRRRRRTATSLPPLAAGVPRGLGVCVYSSTRVLEYSSTSTVVPRYSSTRVLSTAQIRSEPRSEIRRILFREAQITIGPTVGPNY